MKDDPKTEPEFDVDYDDEIEIIEVVGLDEDSPAGTEEPDEEIEVRFEQDLDRTAGDDAVDVDDEATRDRLLRLQAEFENFKKRIERDRDEHYRHATAVLVARLLPVLDNFERALAANGGEGGSDAFREGVALIHRQFLEELRKEGLRAVEAVGARFDPEVHEAVATDATTDDPPNTVLDELQRGYYFQDRLLRPAAVRVSVDASADADTDPDDGERLES